MKRTRLFITFLVFMVLFIAACGQQTTTEKTETSPIKLGMYAPLTGEAASFGDNSLAGAQLAVKEINDAGGINGRQVELVTEDDACSNKGVDAITKLIDVDQVDAIIGPVCSSSGAPSLPIAQERGVPVVIIAASNPSLPKIGDYIFRVYPSDAFQGKVAAEFIYSTLGKKKIAVLNVQDDWGLGLTGVFKQRYTELGGEILYESSFLSTEKDFKTELIKVKNSGAEALYFPARPATGLAAFKQMKESDFDMPVVGGDFFDATEVISNDVSDGIIYTVARIGQPDEFVAKLRAQPGFEKLEVNIAGPASYDAAKAVFEAMQRAGSTDRIAVKEALKTTSYKGVSNPLIEFDDDGDLKAAVYDIKVIKDGKAVIYE